MRRRAGIGGLQQQRRQRQAFREKGAELAEADAKHIEKALESFRDGLEKFALKHRKKINKNPQFRAQFNEMCHKIGVDPLASNKGFWAQVLGMGNFYYKLAVQVLEVCLRTRDRNGGLLRLSDLLVSLEKSRGQAQKVTASDVQQAVRSVECLGNGLRLVTLSEAARSNIEDNADDVMICSVPVELNRDHSALLHVARDTGSVTVESAAAALRWEKQRVRVALAQMLDASLAWVDGERSDPSTAYYFPSLFSFFASM
ncbi:MAG: hypothetical protein MHM6MM_002760 [Cercozoa sp. M6MM]